MQKQGFRIRVKKRIDAALKMHPYETMLYVFMGGSALLFFTLLIMFTFQMSKVTTPEVELQLPKAFIISTILLIFSNRLMRRVRMSFYEDNLLSASRFLLSIIILSASFMFFQLMGWMELLGKGSKFSGTNNGAPYLYMMSGIHLLHFFVGFVILALRYYSFAKKSGDPAEILLTVTNPYEKVKLRMLSAYWAYLDYVWLLMFIVILIKTR
jgi:cytochrome c oxidase subunit 3